MTVSRNEDLYVLPLDGVEFRAACGGNTHPDGESCVTLARIGPGVWAMGVPAPAAPDGAGRDLSARCGRALPAGGGGVAYR